MSGARCRRSRTRRSSGNQRVARRLTACSRATALLLLVLLTVMPGANSGRSHDVLDAVNSCGDSRVTSVTCLMDIGVHAVVDVTLESADGARTALCGVPLTPNLNIKSYNLPPGDNIYGVQACYRDELLVGITFSSAGGPLICGNPDSTLATCKSTVVGEQAPLAALYGRCGSSGLGRIDKVCFNAFYVNPVIPITTCPPGQGRTLGNNEPCQPCPRNFYNPGGLQADCLPCPYGLVTTSEGAACCGCPPGFGANPDRSARARKCVKCPPGTYYPGGNVEPCWRCRGSAYLTTQPGAASIVQCVCRPGYGATLDAPNSCQPCPKGTFSNALAEATPQEPLGALVRFPPGTGNGKGKGGCYTCNPTWKTCTSCCEGGGTQRACNLTTATPGSTSFDQCLPIASFNDPGSRRKH